MTTSLNTVLSTVITTLTTLGLGDVHVASYVPRESDGSISLPPSGAYFVIHEITDDTRYEWGARREGEAELQIEAYSQDPSVAIANIEAARAALQNARFVPGQVQPKPSTTQSPLRGYLLRVRHGHN